MSKYKTFDRSRLTLGGLRERKSKFDVSRIIDPDSAPPVLGPADEKKVEEVARYLLESKNRGRPIVMAYGAHLIKNGCSAILARLMEMGFVQQLLTNGAGAIHDFELSYLGKTEEDVRETMSRGQMGLWDETGKYINLSIIAGNRQNLGYGESLGKSILEERVDEETIDFPFKKASILARAYELSIPLSVCVGIGQDITHDHPLCDGAAVGATSYRDFLIFAKTLSDLEDGVFLSMGSAVMSPMVFEKAISMAKNLAVGNRRTLNRYKIVVNDIQPMECDWHEKEPGKDHPSYYTRFFKSFSRAGGDFVYVQLDNRAFIHNLYKKLVSP